MDKTTSPTVTFQESHVEVDGLQIKCQEAGQGDPVVILDGFSWGIRDLHETLAQKFHVVAMGLPGFGSSTENSVSQSAQDLARVSAQALAKIAPEGYTLIGTSFSANVALWHTLLAPDPVEALVLISPTCLLPAEVLKSGSAGEVAARLLAHPDQSPGFPKVDQAVIEKEASLMRLLGGCTHDDEAEARLSGVQCPTLVVFGSLDSLVPPQAGSIYRDNIPNSNLSIVYDAGHAIIVERPEALINAVTDYVERRETFVVSRHSGMVSP